MSVIHDALRRDNSAAGVQPRAAQADSVLAALGYRADRRTSRRAKVLIGVLIAIGAAVYIVVAFSHAPDGPGRSLAPIARPAPPLRVVTRPPTLRAPAISATHAAAASAPLVFVSKRAVAGAPVVHQVARGAPPPPVTRAGRGQSSIAVAPTPARDAPDDFQLALYYQRAGDFEQALVHYKAVIGRDELNLEAHNNLGRLYLDKGLTDEAIREFQRVTAIDPRYVRARVNLAAAYFKQGRYDLSAAEARAALSSDAKDVDALVNLALAEKASGQTRDARESLLAALRIDQHNAAAHYNLARQYEDVGESALAVSHYEAFLKYAGPDQAAYASDVRNRITALSAKIK